MVLLIITPAAKAALVEYCRRQKDGDEGYSDEAKERREKLSTAEVGSPIEHHELVEVSKFLVQNGHQSSSLAKEWRLDALLRGAHLHQPPPPPKPEPTDEYRRLMHRLRMQEEQRQYERMINPPTQPETFTQRFPNAVSSSFASIGSTAADEVDEITYSDVNRQMVLIINVLVSIICTSVAVWMAARRWDVPQRMGLAFFSSTLVAVAEVAIYMGYIRRIQEAKVKERKQVEKKKILDTWVIDGKTSYSSPPIAPGDSMRFRKGKHR